MFNEMFRRLLNICISNASIIYRQNMMNQKKDNLKFKTDLVEDLRAEHGLGVERFQDGTR